MGKVKTSLNENVLRITLTSPESGNLLDDETLGSILEAMEKGSNASVLVLGAQGPDFSVGRPKPRASIGLNKAASSNVQNALEMVHAINMKLRNWKGVSIAVFRGKANGAAAGFILNSDIAIGELGSHLGFAEMTYNLPPALVATYLPNRIMPRIAQYLLLTGAQIEIDRALSWGLVHEAHPKEQMNKRVEKLIEFLGSRAPGAIYHCKTALYTFWNQEHEAAGPEGIDMVLSWLRREADESS